MLHPQPLIRVGSRIVILRISPTIEDVPAPPGVSTRASGGFCRGRRVVDHPNFIQMVGADHDLVECRVVVDGIGVNPICLAILTGVDIDPFWVFCDHSEIRLHRIRVLYEMIPEMPLPNNLSRGRSSLRHFDDVLWPDRTLVDRVRSPPRCNRFCCGLELPGEHQDIPVGQWLNVMVMLHRRARIIESPGDIAIPVEEFEKASDPPSADRQRSRRSSRAK